MDKAIETLIRQCARWAVAAEQDENIIIAALHANYAAGYLWALLDIASPKDIKRVTGVDTLRLKGEVTKIQDMVTRRMAKECPKFRPDESYLAKIAGEL